MPSPLTLQSSGERPQNNRGQILSLALMVASVVFVVDFFLPTGIAEGVPYVAVVLIGLRSPEKNDSLRLAGLCTVLTIVGYGLSPAGTEPWIGMINRSIALFAIWSTALLAMQVREADAATRDQSSMLTGILSNMPAVAFRIDQEGVMHDSFGRGLTRFGLKELTAIGRIPLEPPDRIKSEIKEGTLANSVFYESNGILQGKPWWFLNCLCKLEGDQPGLIGFGIDITDRKRAERRLALHDAIADILTTASSISETYPQILKAICHTLDWRVGILWRMDYQRQALGAAVIWPQDSPQAQAMSSSNSGWALTPAVGLAGQVWDNRSPLWIKDLADYPKDPRNQAALAVGLHAGFAIPICLAGNTRAVLEFFSPFPEEADDMLLQRLANIGFQIGQGIEREHKERRLATHHGLTNVLAESAGMTQAASLILEAIGENLGWDLGAIWILDSSQQVLRCLNVWHSPHLNLDAFRQASHAITLARGVGLPGRVWKGGEPSWVTDVVSDPNFPRADAAAHEGLHSGFAFPIKSGNEILGVIEFFHRDIQKPDKELLAMFASIGLQIGQFIQRTTKPGLNG
ncbi:MAG TPA: GAF domain-containing protein [Nitrospirales bacterium]|nr:GAF domain-containing protein [Nitrospira sp. MA-1]HNP59326.1 GAF domain-containing protein [Nitrospirales bacterium]